MKTKINGPWSVFYAAEGPGVYGKYVKVTNDQVNVLGFVTELDLKRGDKIEIYIKKI